MQCAGSVRVSTEYEKQLTHPSWVLARLTKRCSMEANFQKLGLFCNEMLQFSVEAIFERFKICKN